MGKLTLTPTALFLAAVALGGCYDNETADRSDAGGGSGDTTDTIGGDTADGSGDDRPDLTDCIDNLDCRGGEVCRQGECRESCDVDDPCVGLLAACDPLREYCVECVVEADCASGERCVESWCEFFCTDDLQCGAGTFCDFPTGTCFVPECASDADCAGGERCGDLRCVPIDTPIDDVCRGDDECAEGEVCVGGECVDAGPTACGSDADCGGGERCAAGFCVPIDTECTVDGDCAAGEQCIVGACVPVETSDCVSDFDCAGGERCDAGLCVPIETPECSTDGDCPVGEACVEGACEPIATGCTTTDDCADGFECIFGTCIELFPTDDCVFDSDCSAGEICVDSVCVLDSVENQCPVAQGGCRVSGASAPFSAVVSANPGTTVECSGAGSYDPDGTIEAYRWSIASRPGASTATILTPRQREASMTVDVAGAYTLELAAFDNEALQSCFPLEVTINVTDAPVDTGLRFELTWVTPGDPIVGDASGSDMDVRLRRYGVDCWGDDGACSYINNSPDWGLLGSTADDPSLDIDDLNGEGPEVLNYPQPASGTFVVGVDYFGDRGLGESTATLRIYQGTRLVAERTRVMTDKQFWAVGTVTWPGAAFTALDAIYADINNDLCE